MKLMFYISHESYYSYEFLMAFYRPACLQNSINTLRMVFDVTSIFAIRSFKFDYFFFFVPDEIFKFLKKQNEQLCPRVIKIESMGKKKQTS